MRELDLREILQNGKRIVFFGGAGTSTESGIPDFRSGDGLYNADHTSQYTPEEILSRSFFERYPEAFYSFYKAKMIYPDAKPNAAHRALARMEQDGRLSAVITQNIDGLHQAAGSQKVLELHGSVHRNRCIRCGKAFSLTEMLAREETIPLCPACGGVIKPDVVLYEETLNMAVLDKAIQAIVAADVLIVGGTSLSVNPAAGLVRYFRGNPLVLINKSATPYDNSADLVIREGIGKVLEEAYPPPTETR
ncbi:NAD-dependent protein deacylase [Gorillibacterium massiliense]|uniref:NAD-dependent protein deacylase n=1 Tax=Gorillibacterium massiliense TaxID=1280390 RepID=UPI0004BCBEB2|nr:NAD-dependent protein deacylase [Gorillibacterium massiliense]